jgi:hypothetical protein
MREPARFFRVALLVAAVGGRFVFGSAVTGIVLRGVVVDRALQTPLADVRVSILETASEALTSTAGEYRIEKAPPGTHRILFVKDGYAPVIVRIRLTVDQPDVRADAALDRLASEITVTADAFPRPETAASSRRELTGAELRSIPGTFEDVARALQVIPGVATSGDYKNDLIVRGGAPSENMFLIDQIQIPGISHFGSQNSSGGFFGLINPGLVRGIEFYSGGFPAYFGDKISSVTRIRLAEGSRTAFGGRLGLSLLGASAQAEGPLFSDRGSWILAARKDYFSVIPRSFTMDLTVVPDFEDVQLKAVYDVARGVQVSFLGMGARDHIRIEESNDPPENRMKIDIGDRQSVFGSTLRALLGTKGVAYATVSRTDSRYGYAYVSHGLERYSIRSDDSEETVRADAEYTPLSGFQWMGGFSIKRVEADHHMYYRGGMIVIDRMGFRYTRTNTSASLASTKTAVYLQTSLPMTKRFSVTAGVRADRFEAIGKTAVSPRLGLSYRFSEKAGVHGSAGIYYQSPETFWLASHPDNDSLPFIKAVHVLVGGEFSPFRDLLVRTEIYAKTYSHYPVDPSNPFLTLANLGGSVIPTFFGSRLTAAGSGFARGFECSVRATGAGRWSWFVDYSYAVVKYKALDGILRNGDFDFRHLFNFVGTCRLGSSWDLSVKWRLTGGQPYTPFDMALSTARDSSYFDLTAINTARYPAYHRLDLRIGKRFSFNRVTLDVYLDVQNVYNRKNVYYRFWDDGGAKTVYFLPLVPFFGIQASF